MAPTAIAAIGAGVLAGVLLTASCTTQRTPESSTKYDAARKQAPGFALKDADGRTVTLDDYKGKVVLLNFWATNCGPCKIEIPWFY